MTGSKISPSADHSIRTKILTSPSPLAHSGNWHVSLRSPRDDNREMWSEWQWCGTSTALKVLSIHQETWNPPLPTWGCPHWSGLQLPWDVPGTAMSKFAIPLVLKIGLALYVTPFQREEPPSSWPLMASQPLILLGTRSLCWTGFIPIRTRLSSPRYHLQRTPGGTTVGQLYPEPPKAQYRGAAQFGALVVSKSAHRPSGLLPRT